MENQRLKSSAKPMVMDSDDLQDFRAAIKCYACAWSPRSGEALVKDHCHWTGAYRGAACQSCNIKMQVPKVVKVLFHNLEGFDGHQMILTDP